MNGTDVHSAMSGHVIKATESKTYGKYIIIEDGDMQTVYAHCRELLVNEGEYVEQGKVIAKSGSTGYSTGPHLHFEIRINDNTINPREVLKF